jgi:hypothetical protein
MSIVENWSAGPGMLRSVGLQGVTYDGGVWAFESVLEDKTVVAFRLHRVDDHTFEGSSSRGVVNRWVRAR